VVAGRLSASMVSLTFACEFPECSHSDWTIERHHFEAEYGESLETIDHDLVVIHEWFDGLFAAVARWTVGVYIRVSLGGRHHGIPSLPGGRCCGFEPKRMLPLDRSLNVSKLHLLRCSRVMGESDFLLLGGAVLTNARHHGKAVINTLLSGSQSSIGWAGQLNRGLDNVADMGPSRCGPAAHKPATQALRVLRVYKTPGTDHDLRAPRGGIKSTGFEGCPLGTMVSVLPA
jgi:hypothetical protein